LELILRSLPEDCIFNLVSFGSKFTSLFPESKPYTEETFKKALDHTKSMDASYGGTEIYSVLQWVLQTSQDKRKEYIDFPTAIFVLTDGQVYNVDQIVNLISDSLSKRNDLLRLFSLGIGNSVSHNLLESISRAGKGYAQFVTTQERMDKKIIGMLKNAVKPPIKDYKITWIDEKSSTDNDDKPSASSFINFFKKLSSDATITSTLKYCSTPYKIPILYSGVRFIIYCFLSKEVSPPKHIILEAACEDGPIHLEIPIDPVTLQGSKIHTLGARKMIQDFEEGSSYLHHIMKNKEDNNLDQGIVREQIVDLGKRFSLASRYTSFLAIDERENSQLSVTKISQKSEIQLQSIQRKSLSIESPTSSIQRLSGKSVLKSRQTSKSKKISSIFESFFSKKSKSASKRSNSQPFLSDDGGVDRFTLERGENIEILFNFLRLQSYDGKFLASKEFYRYFDDGEDKINSNLKKSIPELEEKNKLIKEEIWTTSIAIKYLEIVLFPKFKEESEICFEKAAKVLKKLVIENGDGCKGNNSEEKVKWILEKAGEWITRWVNES
ncbi:10455_t:CDS:2, partial [Diversispora eburnea]